MPRATPPSSVATFPRRRGPTGSQPSRPTTRAIAEQASRVAFDNFQLSMPLLSAERWLQINPSSEQADRYAGVAALALHRLDEAEATFAR